MALIFEKSQPNRKAQSIVGNQPLVCDLPQKFLRQDTPILPEVSELQAVRHFTNLAQKHKNFSIDTNMYPLGSCTMKYNPKVATTIAQLEGFAMRHPYATNDKSQGFLSIMYELQAMLAQITGMQAVSLSPMAGAQGEFAGVLMIKKYHEKNNDFARTEMLVPDSAHGTNPASAVMCGFVVKEIPTDKNGDLDLTALKNALSEKTAGIMLTNPSTLGLFEKNILEIANLVHAAGGLLYYDGANLNALLGAVRPAEMGFDVMHMNLHKTFSTPHGGGGPGSGSIACNEKLAPFLPVPMVIQQDERYVLADNKFFVDSIGQLCTFFGNAGVLLRAYTYIKMLGREGLPRVAEYAVLNSAYLQQKLQQMGYTLAYPQRRASHEFIITLKHEKAQYGVTALDVAKRLLDYGFHAPTIYFPLLIPECMLIEPTETENLEDLDAFLAAMAQIFREIRETPEILKTAPQSLAFSRFDEVKAVKELDIKY